MAKLVVVIVFHDQVGHFHSERAKAVSDRADTPTAANFAATAAMSVELDRPVPSTRTSECCRYLCPRCIGWPAHVVDTRAFAAFTTQSAWAIENSPTFTASAD